MRAINLSLNVERACISRSLCPGRHRRVTHSLRDPFFHSAFRTSTSYESSLESHSRAFPTISSLSLSLFLPPSPPLTSSAGYFSLSQPGLRILATCHCPRNDHTVSDSLSWDNISLGHPIIAEMQLTMRDYFHGLSISFFPSLTRIDLDYEFYDLEIYDHDRKTV